MKNHQIIVKQKLALMFSDKKAVQVLNQAELHAVREYLENDLSQFGNKSMNQIALQKLLEESYVLDIESDSMPFSHKIVKE